MFGRFLDYVPGASYVGSYFGGYNQSEPEDEVIDFTQRTYDPSNKKHEAHLIEQARLSKRYYNALSWHDTKWIACPAAALGYAEYNAGLSVLLHLFFLTLMVAYIAFYLCYGKSSERQEYNVRFYEKLNDVEAEYQALVAQSAKAMEEARAAKGKEIDMDKALIVETTIKLDGLTRKIQAIIIDDNDNYVLKFGQKIVELPIELKNDKGNKTTQVKTVIVDNENLLNLLRQFAKFASSEELVKPFVDNKLGQSDISPAVLDVLASPPHHIVFLPSKEQMVKEAEKKKTEGNSSEASTSSSKPSNALALIKGPTHSVSDLVNTYAAHTRFFVYGRGKSGAPNLTEMANNVKDKATELVQAGVSNVSIKLG